MHRLTQAITCLAIATAAAACGGASTPAAQLAESAAESSPDAAASGAAKNSDRSSDAAGAEAAASTPRWREVTLPAGTTVPVTLETAVGSDTSRVEDPVRGRVSRAVVIDGVTALPEGSTVEGVVTDAARAGKVQGTSRLAMRFDSLTPPDSEESYSIETRTVARSGPTQKKKDALQIGAPAAGGAIIGGIVGGKKGAVIGGAAGGGAGTAVVLTQRGKDVRLGRGAAITLRLTEPVTIRIKA
jgi:hypothetical protein